MVNMMINQHISRDLIFRQTKVEVSIHGVAKTIWFTPKKKMEKDDLGGKRRYIPILDAPVQPITRLFNQFSGYQLNQFNQFITKQGTLW